jgi:hypothetical protein
MPGQIPGSAPGYQQPTPSAPPVAGYPANAGTVPYGTNPSQAGNGFAQPSNAYPPQGGYQPGPQQFQAPQGYPQQQWGQPGPQQFQPAAPVQQYTLDDFGSQPSGPNGPSLTKLVQGNQWPVGTEWLCVIKRDVTDADVSHQTELNTNRPLFNKDGSAKLSIAIHVEAIQIVMQGQVYPSPNHADGNGTWYIQGRARDEWARARQEAGCPPGTFGLRGERVRVKLAGRRPIPGVPQPANDWEIHVTPANGVQTPQPATTQSLAPQQAQQPAAGQALAPQVSPVWQAMEYGAASAQPVVQPGPQAAGQPAPPPTLNDRQQALLQQFQQGGS